MIVVAGVVIHDGKIMIARRSVQKSNGGLWEFPGGKLEVGESDQVGLVREFTEEFGMEIDVKSELGIFPFTSQNLLIELRVWFCTARTLPIHATDHDLIEWVMPNQLLTYQFSPADIPVVELIQTGKIRVA